MRRNVLITMSGGTTSVINATLCGLITGIRKHLPAGGRILAGHPGIVGLLAGQVRDLTGLSTADLGRLYRTPASGFIGTTRVEPVDDSWRQPLQERFAEFDVGYFVNIGGSGTIQQSRKIGDLVGEEVAIAAVPKTVDNDFGDPDFVDTYFTPGFPSCANYWRHKTHIMNLENLGACSHDQILIAQTFGRQTGFLAACARLGDPERRMPLMLLLPEDLQTKSQVVARLQAMVAEHGRAIVVMSEGYDVADFAKRYDASGQIMYGSTDTTNAQLLMAACFEAGLRARVFLPGFDQRSDSRFVSTIDLESAYGVGLHTAKSLSDGERSFFASVCRMPAALNGIGFTSLPFAELPTNMHRRLKPEWVAEGAFDVTDAFIDYASTLIGEGQLPLPNSQQNEFFAY
ncbi:6-phosphofructokinase [Actomonas aquatica]|uniref:6-phosphofructokinase n=1 Tax=Actomonas aquatica TaxID=2866162 RepID=A0ABZ1C9M3_9BACT|nr:6-phosphofructokinase [Opitutus sp. WL0086]WRQ88392.1 6-phosphofructokinase [Opitutus sp. WL0086]